MSIHSKRRIVLAAALLLVTSACGTRLSRDQLLAAGEGPANITQATAGTARTAGSTAGGTSGSAGVGGAGGTAGAVDTGGSGGGATTGAGGDTGSTPAAGATVANKSPVVIATVATISGPVAAFVKDSVQAVGVWAQWVNSRGGLNGHPVKFVVSDDGGDPAKYNALVQQSVEQQGAIAFVFNTVGFAPAGNMSYMEAHNIPVIGHEGGTNVAYSSPMLFTPFPSGSTYAKSLINAFGSVAVPQGKLKLATLACSDVALCDLFDASWSGADAQAAGFQTVYRARPSLTQPDFTAECLSAKQAGADAMIMALDNNSVLRVASACARQNYHPLLGMADQLALPSVATDPNMEGAVVGTKVAPWPAQDKPGLQELYQAFAQFAPGVQVDGAHVGGWVSAKALEAAARNLPDDPKPSDVLAGLWALSGDDLGGLTYPLSFAQGQPSPQVGCFGVVVIHDKQFTTPNGGNVSCF